MLDLAALDTTELSNEGVWKPILRPDTREETGMEVLVLGADSAAYRKAERANQVKRLQGRGAVTAQAIVEMEDSRVAVYAACLKDWRSPEGKTIPYKGDDLSCTQENAIRLLTEQPWIREQVVMYVENRVNFMKG